MIVKTLFQTAEDYGIKGCKLLLTYYFHKLHAKYSGHGVYCPVCGWTGKQFHPFLLQPMWVRPAASCPKCGELERHRALYVFYSQVFKNIETEGKKCLHFAPESCFKTLFHDMPIEYITSEYNGPDEGDMQNIKYPDQSFDFIISHHVLEHVHDDRKALSEIWRVLKDNGIFYLSVPVSWGTKTQEYGFPNPDDNYHYRNYGDDITSKFRSFIWKRIDFKELLDSQRIKCFGIYPDEPLFELKKDEHSNPHN